ncbi:MAG: GlcNAc-transferase family protein [Edaphobacter sp.]
MNNHADLIFISIAAYRDPQLVPTVVDCISKAINPERLRFGICWQRDEEETPLPFHQDPRFRILEVYWRQSKGACWARAQIMQLWDKEDWYLQLDSHCRFAQGWDAMLLRAIADTGSDKPILSTYATPFTPGDREILAGDALQIGLQGFTADGIPQLKPLNFPQHTKRDRPVRARFLAAGFLFVGGHFVEEVPYDPDLYFLGEESAMTVRAFTHGYDLFHPAASIVWHYYGRQSAKKHWDDHIEEDNAPHAWGKLDATSSRKVQRLLSGEPVENYGLGPVRTLEQYETYAGLSFRHCKAQEYTVQAEEPPNPKASPDWIASIYPWITKIALEHSQLPEGSLKDPLTWVIEIQDEHGASIHRRDLTPDELMPLYGNDEKIFLICEFASGATPASWIVWPLNHSQGWLQKVQGQFKEEDFAILKEDGLPGSAC